MDVCMYVGMYVCIYVCMYLCMYVCVCAEKETTLVRHECVCRSNTKPLQFTNEYRPQRAIVAKVCGAKTLKAFCEMKGVNR